MKEKTKRAITGAVLGVGVGVGLAYVSYRLIKKQGLLTSTSPCSGRDNFLSRDAVPKANILRRGTPSAYFGETFKPSEGYIGKPLSRDGHVVVLGQTGSSKTSSIVNPTMETAGAGYNIYLDIKGELAERHMALYGKNPKKKLLVFNPYDTAQRNCYYDPFLSLRREPDLLPDYALQLAKALIPVPPDGHNLVWTESAISYTAGVIIDSFNAGLNFTDTMERINSSAIAETIKSIMVGGDSAAKCFVSKFSDLEPKTIAGIGMEITNSLSSFAASKAFRDAFSASSKKELLDWDDLNTGEPFDVILVLPEDKLNVMSPIYRAMVSQMVTSLARRKRRTYDSMELPPVLIVLDEIAQLGRISVLEHALSTLRCRGVTIVLLIQSLAGLEAVYGEMPTRSIMENCEYKVILGSTDVESQSYLAKLVGTIPVRHEGTSMSIAMETSVSVSRSYSAGRENVIQPHAFHTLKDEVLYTPDGVFRIRKHPVFGGDSVFDGPEGVQQ